MMMYEGKYKDKDGKTHNIRFNNEAYFEDIKSMDEMELNDFAIKTLSNIIEYTFNTSDPGDAVETIWDISPAYIRPIEYLEQYSNIYTDISFSCALATIGDVMTKEESDYFYDHGYIEVLKSIIKAEELLCDGDDAWIYTDGGMIIRCETSVEFREYERAFHIYRRHEDDEDYYYVDYFIKNFC